LPAATNLLTYSGWQDALAKFDTIDNARPKPAIVMSFDPTSAALASWLIGSSSQAADFRHITGIFHPRAYFLDGEDRLRRAINRMILANFRNDQLVFMNTDSRDTHARWSGRDFASSPILPLGITERPAAYVAGSNPDFRVASVGRLVSFKEFNLEIPRMVAELRAKGVPISWHIFGTGELEAQIRASIDELAIGEWVKLRGNLPYADFSAEMLRFDAFVGMGTAVLEAAMLGIPSIIAIDSEGARTYGFVQDVPFGNVGEQQNQPPAEHIADLLADLHSLSAKKRAAIGVASRQAVLGYSIPNYVAGLERIGTTSSKPRKYRSWLLGMLYHQVTEGLTRRTVSRALRKFR
jgi:glycosyltransferase involved in cell wall biosynthesis